MTFYDCNTAQWYTKVEDNRERIVPQEKQENFPAVQSDVIVASKRVFTILEDPISSRALKIPQDASQYVLYLPNKQEDVQNGTGNSRSNNTFCLGDDCNAVFCLLQNRFSPGHRFLLKQVRQLAKATYSKEAGNKCGFAQLADLFTYRMTPECVTIPLPDLGANI